VGGGGAPPLEGESEFGSPSAGMGGGTGEGERAPRPRGEVAAAEPVAEPGRDPGAAGEPDVPGDNGPVASAAIALPSAAKRESSLSTGGDNVPPHPAGPVTPTRTRAPTPAASAAAARAARVTARPSRSRPGSTGTMTQASSIRGRRRAASSSASTRERRGGGGPVVDSPFSEVSPAAGEAPMERTTSLAHAGARLGSSAVPTTSYPSLCAVGGRETVGAAQQGGRTARRGARPPRHCSRAARTVRVAARRTQVEIPLRITRRE